MLETRVALPPLETAGNATRVWGRPLPKSKKGDEYRQSGPKDPRIGLELRLASSVGASHMSILEMSGRGPGAPCIRF